MRRLALAIAALLLFTAAAPASFNDHPPDTALHYAPNGNFDNTGVFLPGRIGFNVADITDSAQLKSLPKDVRALVWVGQCEGVTAKFVEAVSPFLHDRRVFGFYLMDDPDPRARRGVPPSCPAQNLRAESDWLHEHLPGTKTVVVLMNLSDARTPSYMNGYNPENTHIDLFGLCAYPCRTAFNGCDFDTIDRYVAASDKAGIPRNMLVPIYQAFGEGRWSDDWGGSYTMPGPADEAEIIRRWQVLVPTPVLDMAYSWGNQRGDVTLHDSQSVMQVLSLHNRQNVAP